MKELAAPSSWPTSNTVVMAMNDGEVELFFFGLIATPLDVGAVANG